MKVIFASTAFAWAAWSFGTLTLAMNFVTQNASVPPRNFSSLSVRPVCAAALEPLIEQLLLDFPSYANRVIQRTRRFSDTYVPIIVVVAGRSFNRYP